MITFILLANPAASPPRRTFGGNALAFRFKGFVNDELLMEYEAQRSLRGYTGLWSKADSVTHFEDLQIQSGQTVRKIEF